MFQITFLFKFWTNSYNLDCVTVKYIQECSRKFCIFLVNRSKRVIFSQMDFRISIRIKNQFIIIIYFPINVYKGVILFSNVAPKTLGSIFSKWAFQVSNLKLLQLAVKLSFWDISFLNSRIYFQYGISSISWNRYFRLCVWFLRSHHIYYCNYFSFGFLNLVMSIFNRFFDDQLNRLSKNRFFFDFDLSITL